MVEHRRVRVKIAYVTEFANPVVVARGEKVSVGREDDEFPGWKWCKAQDGREGWVPRELLSGDGAEAVLLEDYSARELDVEPGEELVIEDSRQGWLLQRQREARLGARKKYGGGALVSDAHLRGRPYAEVILGADSTRIARHVRAG